MSRANRLLDLLQLLRRYRRPVSGQALAEELAISLRTLYRDIEALKAQGADIAGEAGVGYVLRPGFMLPPLMFSAEELEAIFAGIQWVADRGDPGLGSAALEALAKIRSVLPEDLRYQLDQSGLLVSSQESYPDIRIETGVIREAMRRERKLRITYRDAEGEASRRVVWPVAYGLMKTTEVLAAWCELRQDYRHFRADRIERLTLLEVRLPRRRADLFKEWRARENLSEPAARKLY